MSLRYLLLDGTNIARRCFHAVNADLRTADGFPTNMLKGYLNSTNAMLSIVQPDYVFHFFDEGRDQQRVALHSGYDP